jgi:hypothetical protein
MVFVDRRNLGFKPFIWRWLSARPPGTQTEELRGLFDKYAGAHAARPQVLPTDLRACLGGGRAAELAPGRRSALAPPPS